MKRICSAVARLQKADQTPEKPQPAAKTAESPPERFSLFPPRVTWSHENPKAEIAVKPRRNGVLWSRSS